MNLRKLAERIYLAYRAPEVVNCSTCPHWIYHSEQPGTREARVVQDGQSFRLERSNNEPLPERWGVCMKAPIRAVPLEGVGNSVRATAAGDICAHHPGYVPPKVATGAKFMPGVGELAGFDKAPSLRDAMAFGRLRPGHLPDLAALNRFGLDWALNDLKRRENALKPPEQTDNAPDNAPEKPNKAD